jgi:hypothetical protein
MEITEKKKSALYVFGFIGLLVDAAAGCWRSGRIKRRAGAGAINGPAGHQSQKAMANKRSFQT